MSSRKSQPEQLEISGASTLLKLLCLERFSAERPQDHPDADAGFVIMEQVEYPPMSGTNTIAVTTVLLETGMIPAKEPITEITLEAPAGLIRVRAEVRNEKVKSVTFENVPAFAMHIDEKIEQAEDAKLSEKSRRVMTGK